ncbi:protein of unknown function [Burkholderia multivorans]
MDRGRRRSADDRSRGDAGQGQRDPHRLARRRDEGVGRGCALGRAFAFAPSRREGRGVREAGHPHPRAGRRDAEGRSVRRHRDDDRAGVGVDGHPGARRCRDDGRNHVARRSLADRWPEGEAAGRAPWRHQARADSGREREGSRGHSGQREERDRNRAGPLDRQGARTRARACAGSAAAGRGSQGSGSGRRSGEGCRLDGSGQALRLPASVFTVVEEPAACPRVFFVRARRAARRDVRIAVASPVG